MNHTETERKFLVADDSYRAMATESHRMTQGYICRESGRTVRVRISDGRGWLTIKGKGSDNGMSRYEWETEIPADEAGDLMRLCLEGIIDKTRYMVPFGGHTFEVDEFYGENEPEWLGKEVTGDRRYYNSMLTQNPYSQW